MTRRISGSPDNELFQRRDRRLGTLQAFVVALVVILTLFLLFELSGYRQAARDFTDQCVRAGGHVIWARNEPMCFSPDGQLIPIY